MKIYVECGYGMVSAIYTDAKDVSLDVVVCDNDVFNEITSRNYENEEDDDFDEVEAGMQEYRNLEFEERIAVDNVIGLHMEKRNLKMIYPKISKQQFTH